MDELRCNSFKTCRKALGASAAEAQAVVTTCSHIFCCDCANQYFNADPAQRTCPACHAKLPTDDDVLMTCLNPTSDYKSTALSGLAPAVICDIATRALSFWVYQCGQESIYQRLQLKKAQDKASNLEKQYNTLAQEAVDEINSMTSKLNIAETELEQERNRIRELMEDQKEAARNYSKLKMQLDRIKGNSLMPGAEQEAEQDYGQMSEPQQQPQQQQRLFGATPQRVFQPQQQNHQPQQQWDVPPQSATFGNGSGPVPFRQTPRRTPPTGLNAAQKIRPAPLLQQRPMQNGPRLSSTQSNFVRASSLNNPRTGIPQPGAIRNPLNRSR